MTHGSDIGQVNPFHAQWNSKFFVGRQDELRIFEKNLAGLRDGQQSHLLVAGVHGTGKSFYLNKLIEIANSRNCVSVFSNLEETTAIEQAKTLLRETIRQVDSQPETNQASASKPLSSDFDKGSNSQLFSLPRRTDLNAGDLQGDFSVAVQKAHAIGRLGIVVCIDEGQRITRQLLSCIKNALSRLPGILIVLSWRLASDEKGAVNQAHQELLNRVSDTEYDKDIGAASFFSSATGMGPFVTDAEVATYFNARLTGNAIKFSPDVVLRLGEVANRVPRPMTVLAHDVYERASRLHIGDVNADVLNECFRDRYSSQVKEATDLCSDLANDTMSTLRAICRLSKPASAAEIVASAFPNTDATHHRLLSEGVGKQLDTLCQSSVLLRKTDQKYEVVDSFRRYALKIALGIA